MTDLYQQTIVDHAKRPRNFGPLAGANRSALGVNPLMQANPDLDRKLQEASVRATLPVFFPAKPSQPYGWMDPMEWAAYGRWMYENKLLNSPPNTAAAVTNEFLPGQGPTSGS